MRSRHIIHLLSDYLENLLDDPTRKHVEKHLSSCSRCKKRLEELQQYQELISKLEPHAAPEEIRTKVMEKIAGAEGSGKWEVGSVKREHGTLRRLITDHRSQITIAAAAIILLLVLIIPKQIFLPTTVSTDIVGLMQKKGKGAVVVGGIFNKKGEKSEERKSKSEDRREKNEERREKSEDRRAKNEERRAKMRRSKSEERRDIYDEGMLWIFDLIEENEGEVLSEELNLTGETYSQIMVKMKKKGYKDFAEAYNSMGMAEKLPEKAPFTLSSNIYVKLFPVQRVFFSGDFNADGYVDMGLHYTGGSLEGKWFVALNNHNGHFYTPLEIELELDTIFIGTKYIPMAGDFNGDGYDDIIIRGMEGKSNGTCFIYTNKNAGKFSEGYRIMVGNSKLSFTCLNIPFTGNFKANEYDDIGVTCTGLKMPNYWYVLNNDLHGHFDHGWNIKPEGIIQPFIGKYIPFAGDFNGDSLCDIGVKWLAGEKAFQYEISFNMGDEQFAAPALFRYNNGYKAWQGNYTHYFGDFNADGLCDIMTKEGNGDVLGAWYISLNIDGTGFGNTYQVSFGGDEYFTGD